ncbi:nucleotidyltransferase domain-containing protein [Selenihalanaerobacter shriftii]|uniref:Predicted nucleotidyltransferase n=1 Tax=Selenihalanaerobacter shriftii TaxID=142842 RepID=A0A1T4NTV1_9FIRM|nr:nucleotidyltransferase domain-containing protein [Selenihalanaerobacter shriftii]SJZ82674.1 Predicted nucleotidyltransferase [Selenihalanaerobacter shriftii]
MISETELRSLTNKISQIIDIKKIILFGSYATGNSDEESDVDLCIITDEEKRKLDIMREIRKNLSTITDYPLDLLVYKEDEFYQKANLKNSFEHQIMEEGSDLYE